MMTVMRIVMLVVTTVMMTMTVTMAMTLVVMMMMMVLLLMMIKMMMKMTVLKMMMMIVLMMMMMMVMVLKVLAFLSKSSDHWCRHASLLGVLPRLLKRGAQLLLSRRYAPNCHNIWKPATKQPALITSKFAARPMRHLPTPRIKSALAVQWCPQCKRFTHLAPERQLMLAVPPVENTVCLDPQKEELPYRNRNHE